MEGMLRVAEGRKDAQGCEGRAAKVGKDELG